MLHKTVGIVIRTQDYGETNKLVTIFTKKIGKVTTISRGSNRPRSRLSAVSQLFIEGDFLLYVPKGLATLRQGDIIKSFRNIRQDLARTAYAAYIVELTDKLMEEKQSDSFLYDQLRLTLDWINREDDYAIPVMMYELKIFKKGGFAPVIDQCVNCHSKDKPFLFSIQEGGALCTRCRTIDEHAIQLEPVLFKILSICLHVGLERIGNIKVKDNNIRVLRMIIDQYYDRYGGFTLKSKKFLEQLDELS